MFWFFPLLLNAENNKCTYRIFDLVFSSAPARRKQQQTFKIRHIQIDELQLGLEGALKMCERVCAYIVFCRGRAPHGHFSFFAKFHQWCAGAGATHYQNVCDVCAGAVENPRTLKVCRNWDYTRVSDTYFITYTDQDPRLSFGIAGSDSNTRLSFSLFVLFSDLR